MESIIRTLADNPIVLLFVVCAIGYPLGRIRIAGASLGAAAIMFVGIGIGAIDKRLKLPDVVYLLGLGIFLYSLGISSARGIFASFNKAGSRNTLLAIATLLVAGAFGHLWCGMLHIKGDLGSGMFNGAFSNAPGLASVIDTLKAQGASTESMSKPVIGYSLAYPFGILGPMVMMLLAKWWFKVDLQKEAETIPSYRRSKQKIETHTLRVTHPEAAGRTIYDLSHNEADTVVFGRVRRNGLDTLVVQPLTLEMGDLVTVNGPIDEIERVALVLGEMADEAIQNDRTDLDVRRIFVSKSDVVGKELRELDLPAKHSAILTSVRRGDIEFVPSGDTRLQLGDRVRAFTRRDNMEEVSKFFGDSYKALSDVDLLTFCLGMGLGVLLGMIPVPIGGGLTFRLGFAGGPLVAGILLGHLERTGVMVWNIPYSANLTLRQFGLLLFAAGIGLRAGYDFYNTLASGQGLPIFIGGAIMTFITGSLILYVGYRLLKIPMNILLGIYAGAQTQPVNLGFANDMAKNDLANLSYATIYPLAAIFKILVSQVLFEVLK